MNLTVSAKLSCYFSKMAFFFPSTGILEFTITVPFSFGQR